MRPNATVHRQLVQEDGAEYVANDVNLCILRTVASELSRAQSASTRDFTFADQITFGNKCCIYPSAESLPVIELQSNMSGHYC